MQTSHCARRPEEPLLQHKSGRSNASPEQSSHVPLRAASNLSAEGAPESSQTAREPNHRGSEKPNEVLANRCMVETTDTQQAVRAKATLCPPDPEFGGPRLPTGTISFPDAPEAPEITVEIARTDQARQRGLMYRRSMEANAGMLFDFPGAERVQTFWMRNTCIALDMLFITHDGFIAGILRNVPTMNEELRSINCPVRYVLELNAGWTAKYHVRAGQSVMLPSS